MPAQYNEGLFGLIYYSLPWWVNIAGRILLQFEEKIVNDCTPGDRKNVSLMAIVDFTAAQLASTKAFFSRRPTIAL